MFLAQLHHAIMETTKRPLAAGRKRAGKI